MTLSAALAYAARGIAVFPIVPHDSPAQITRADGKVIDVQPGKSPATGKGLKDATTDRARIESWWTSNPAFNIGIATGPPGGFWVLDIDGPEGAATLSALEEQHGPLPETPEQTTARGRHICFAYDAARPIRNSASRIGPKIDVRGDGGYIVAAPSRHPSGALYQWHAERRPSRMAFAPAPEWLLELAEKKAAKAAPPSERSKPPVARPSDRLITAYGERILREECAKISGAVDGTVNETINRCSFNVGTIVGAGEIAEHIARAALIDAGMVVCKPPWTIIQVTEHVERALQDGMKHPRQKPELPPRPPHMQPAPRREARTVDQAQPVEEPRPATVVDIRDPSRGYTPDTAWERDIIRNEDGKIVPRTNNAILFLRHHRDMLGVLAWDDFSRQPVLARRPPWEEPDGTDWQTRPIEDNDVTWAVAWLENRGLAMKSAGIHAACIAAAQRNRFNPAIDWLCGLQWDGQERLSSWLEYYCGAQAETQEQRRYVAAIGRKWLIGAVARVMRPGCKMDTMLLLEGPQGIGKSQACRIIGTFGDRSYFTDEIADIGSKDAAMQLQGVAIVELAELNQMERSEVNAIKAWLTRTTDRYRPPYGRMVVEAPRQCVLIGTVNPDGTGYLQDATGARRFWPVAVSAIDHAALQSDQQQLWAEAVAAWRAGEAWWLDDEGDQETAQAEQAARYAGDPWGDAIDRYIGLLDTVTLEQLRGEGCLKLTIERQSRATDNRIGKHLRSRGWIRVRRWNSGEKRPQWVYIRGERE